MILTHEEAKALRDDYMSDPFELIREVESAVIAKLAAGVNVEPVGYLDGQGDAYTIDQLTTAIAAAQVQMNERCAKLVESLMDEQEPWMNGDDIRSLIGATLWLPHKT